MIKTLLKLLLVSAILVSIVVTTVLYYYAVKLEQIPAPMGFIRELTPLEKDKLFLLDLVTNVHKLSISDFRLLSRIARAESGWRMYNKNGEVLRGVVNPKDVCYFQINEYYHLAKATYHGWDIHTPVGCIQYAVHLYHSEGSTPWNWSRSGWE